MSKVDRIILFLVLTCFAHKHDVNALIKSFEKSHNFLEKKLMFDDYSFREGNLVYAVCDGSEKQKNCTIHQENYPDGELLRTCNISVKASQEGTNITDKIYVVPFGQNNVILFWNEVGPTTVFKLLTVKLDDHCVTGELTLPDPNLSIYDQLRLGHKILTYNDTADIIIKDASISDSNNTESLMTIDLNGKVLKKQADLMKSGLDVVRFITTIAKLSPAKGYVYSKIQNNEYSLTIVKPDGSEKLLTMDDKHPHTMMTANHGSITFCVREDKNLRITCTQYNEDGSIISNTTLNYADWNGDAAMSTIHNSPLGGFLLMLVEYQKWNEAKDIINYPRYTVVKVDGKGNKVGRVHLDEFTKIHHSMKWLRRVEIWEKENGEICAIFIGQGRNQTDSQSKPSDLHLFVNCFTDDDFEA